MDEGNNPCEACLPVVGVGEFWWVGEFTASLGMSMLTHAGNSILNFTLGQVVCVILFFNG
jgi:hypothetical protein